MTMPKEMKYDLDDMDIAKNLSNIGAQKAPSVAPAVAEKPVADPSSLKPLVDPTPRPESHPISKEEAEKQENIRLQKYNKYTVIADKLLRKKHGIDLPAQSRQREAEELAQKVLGILKGSTPIGDVQKVSGQEIKI